MGLYGVAYASVLRIMLDFVSFHRYVVYFYCKKKKFNQYHLFDRHEQLLENFCYLMKKSICICLSFSSEILAFFVIDMMAGSIGMMRYLHNWYYLNFKILYCYQQLD